MTRAGFWTAQLVWWFFFAVANHLTSVPAMSDLSLAGHVAMFELKVGKAVVGLGFSLLLYLLYRRLIPRLSLPALGAVALGASMVGGFLWEIGIRAFYSWPLFDTATACDALYPMFVLVAWSALYFSFTYRQRAEAEAARALRADALATLAQLAMLRYQVNPHFLFNALNSLRALIDENTTSARDMVTQLSELFRYSLRTAGDSDLTLGDEVAAIRNYLDIQKIRFEDRLEVRLAVDGAAAATPLPGFLVHPLVENAVKYGLETSPRPLRIEVTARLTAGELRVEVANTGRWLDGRTRGPDLPGPAAQGTGTGLRNLRERLRHLYPECHSLAIGEEDGWVRAALFLRVGEARPLEERGAA